jgi:hypothetical protein
MPKMKKVSGNQHFYGPGHPAAPPISRQILEEKGIVNEGGIGTDHAHRCTEERCY